MQARESYDRNGAWGACSINTLRHADPHEYISATHRRAGGVYREKMVTWCWGSAPMSLEPSAAAPDYAGSPWLSVACEQAGEECDMIWGAQGGGSVRNMRGMDEDDYYAATARIPDILTT